jgi:hypothetical protein
MLGMKLVVSTAAAHIEPDRIVIRDGNVTDIYNRAYYRLIPEVEQDGPIQGAGRGPADDTANAGQA